jgi:hypothetical protein
MAKVPKLTYAEIFQTINDAKDDQARIALMHLHSTPNLKSLLDMVFNPNIKFLLPEGKPPYKDLAKDVEVAVFVYALRQEFRKLAIFTNSGKYTNLNPRKREQLFIDFLGSIHPSDAELLCNIKDKKWPYKNVPPQLIAKAFPKFTKAWKLEEQEVAPAAVKPKKATTKKKPNGEVIQEK